MFLDSVVHCPFLADDCVKLLRIYNTLDSDRAFRFPKSHGYPSFILSDNLSHQRQIFYNITREFFLRLYYIYTPIRENWYILQYWLWPPSRKHIISSCLFRDYFMSFFKILVIYQQLFYLFLNRIFSEKELVTFIRILNVYTLWPRKSIFKNLTYCNTIEMHRYENITILITTAKSWKQVKRLSTRQ